MKTPLHLMLEDLCTKQRTGEKHWALGKVETIRLQDLGGRIVTVRRAIFAAFVGAISDGLEVRPTCGHRRCIKPEHQELFRKKNSRALGLALPDHVASLSKATGFQPHRKEPTLSAGITERVVASTKALLKVNSVEQVRVATNLPIVQVIRIKNGYYDDIFAQKTALEARNLPKSAQNAQKSDKMGPEEEQNWLSMVGKG